MSRLKVSVHVHAAPQGPRNSLHPIQGIVRPSEQPQKFLIVNVKPDTTLGDLWIEIEDRFRRCYLKQSEYAQFEIKKLQDEFDNDLDISYKCGDVFDCGPAPSIVKVTRARIDRECSVPLGSSLRPLDRTFRRSFDQPPPEFSLKQRGTHESNEPYVDLDPDHPVASRESDEDALQVPESPAKNAFTHLVEDSQEESRIVRNERPSQQISREERSPELGSSAVQQAFPGEDGFVKPSLPASRMVFDKTTTPNTLATRYNAPPHLTNPHPPVAHVEKLTVNSQGSPVERSIRSTRRDIFDVPSSIEREVPNPKDSILTKQKPMRISKKASQMTKAIQNQVITPDVSDTSLADAGSYLTNTGADDNRAAFESPLHEQSRARTSTPLTSERTLAKLQERRISRGENPDLRKSPGFHLKDGFDIVASGPDQLQAAQDEELPSSQAESLKIAPKKRQRKTAPPPQTAESTKKPPRKRARASNAPQSKSPKAQVTKQKPAPGPKVDVPPGEIDDHAQDTEEEPEPQHIPEPQIPAASLPNPSIEPLLSVEASKELYERMTAAYRNSPLGKERRARAEVFFDKQDALEKAQEDTVAKTGLSKGDGITTEARNEPTKQTTTKTVKTPRKFVLQTPIEPSQLYMKTSLVDDDQQQLQSDISFVQNARERSNSFGPPLGSVQNELDQATSNTTSLGGKKAPPREKTAPPPSTKTAAALPKSKARAKSAAPAKAESATKEHDGPPAPPITPPSLATQRLRAQLAAKAREASVRKDLSEAPPTIAESSKMGELKRKAAGSPPPDPSAAKRQTKLPFSQSSRKGKEPVVFVNNRVRDLTTDPIVIPSDSEVEEPVPARKPVGRPAARQKAPRNSAKSSEPAAKGGLKRPAKFAGADQTIATNKSTNGSIAADGPTSSPRTALPSISDRQDTTGNDTSVQVEKDERTSEALVEHGKGTEHGENIQSFLSASSDSSDSLASSRSKSSSPAGDEDPTSSKSPETSSEPPKTATVVRTQTKPSATKEATGTPQNIAHQKTISVHRPSSTAPTPRKQPSSPPASPSSESSEEEESSSSANDSSDNDQDAIARDNAKVAKAIQEKGLDSKGAKALQERYKFARKVDRHGVSELAKRQEQAAIFRTFDRVRQSFGSST